MKLLNKPVICVKIYCTCHDNPIKTYVCEYGGNRMKAKVKYRKYGNIPDMDTVKDIIIYGAKQGKHNKQ